MCPPSAALKIVSSLYDPKMHVRNHRAFQHQRTLRRNHGSHGHNRSDEPLNDDFVLYYSPSMSVGIFTIADLLPRVMHAAVASFIEAAAPDVTRSEERRVGKECTSRWSQ